jgi:hypothetical protein
MKMKNRLEDAIKDKGLKEFSPTDELLVTWGMTRKRFYQLLRNEKELFFREAILIAQWLGISPDDLFSRIETVIHE